MYCSSKLKAQNMGRNKILTLTDIQQKTLAEICRYIDRFGYAPTVQELADIFDVSAPSVFDRINQLESKGYIQREGKKSRTLTVLNRPGDMTVKLVSIPLVGTVAAGVPILALENITGEIVVDENIVKDGQCFALKVRGDSMTGAGINDGDTIIVRRQPLAQNGDIVVAMLEDEATVKRLCIDGGNVKLVAENPEYPSIEVSPDDNLRIVGKVIACRNVKL